MATQMVDITLILITGRKYTLRMNTNDTVASLITKFENAYKRDHGGNRPNIGAVYHDGLSVDLSRKLKDVPKFDPSKYFYIWPRQGFGINTSPINFGETQYTLEQKFSDPEFLQKRLNMKGLHNVGEQYNMPENIQRNVGKYLGLKNIKAGGKRRGSVTRKSKKSRRATRRRR